MKKIGAARALFICTILISAILSAAPATRPVAQGCSTPVVTLVTPNSGPLSGGTAVSITGTNFSGNGAVTVTFGGVAATNVVIVNTNQITATTPAGAAAVAVDVTVTNFCTSGTLPNGFTYLPVTAIPALSPLVLAALGAILGFVALVILKK